MKINLVYKREKIGLFYYKALKEFKLVGGVDEGDFCETTNSQAYLSVFP